MSSLDSQTGDVRLTPPSSGAEWAWVLVVSLLILLLSSIPYLVAYHAQTTSLIFSGAVFDRADYAVHLASMHLGARGEWKYHFLFTHEPHPGAYVKLGYIALGQLAGLLRLSLPLMYHLARLFFGFTACLVIYLLSVFTFKEVYWRRICFLLAILGSGFGWFQILLGWLPKADISPIDFWLVDGYVFFSILVFPHFAAVITLVVGMIVTYLAYLRRERWWLLGISIALGVCAQAIQPYSPLLGDIAILGALAGFSWQKKVIRWRDIGILLGFAISQIPLFVYNGMVLKSNPVWVSFLTQNTTLSPPPEYYLWGYIFFWPFVILGMWHLLISLITGKASSEVDRLPGLVAAMSWTIGVLVLAYLPSVLQRRFLLAYTVPLGILSVFGLKTVVSPWLERHMSGWWRRKKGIIPVFIVAFAMISSLILSISTAWNLSMRSQKFFDSAALVKAVDWLGVQALSSDVVLSSEVTGQLVAARVGLPVYLGHPIETMDYQTKLVQVQDFYQGKIDPDLMYSNGVRWVVFGPAEKQLLGLDKFVTGLKKAYQVDDVVIYQLNP